MSTRGPRSAGRARRAVITTGVGLLLMGAAILTPGPALAAEPSTWTVDHDQSRLGFVASQDGAPFEGRFTDWRAEIRFDPDAPEASSVAVEVVIASLTTGDTIRDGTAMGAAWFDARSFTSARFEADGFTALGDTRYEAPGTLTLKGASVPLTLPFELTLDGDEARMSSRVVIDRMAWSLGTGEFATPTPVAFEVTIEVDLTAARE